MTAFSEPTKWAQSLGATANADVIPDEAGATDVDISKIFPAVFSVPLAQGGKAIPRRTLNGIFKTLGEWAFYTQNGGVPSYDADFDYTVGRFVSYNSSLYKCIQDNVHTDPHNPTDKDYWAELSDSSSIQVVIDNIVTDLNRKADRSLSNVDNTANILMAHNAMPSDKQIELTLGASESKYVMPADGYIHISKVYDNVTGGYLQVIVHTATNYYDVFSDNLTWGTSLLVPVWGHSTVEIIYNLNGNTVAFSFIYAQGASLGD